MRKYILLLVLCSLASISRADLHLAPPYELVKKASNSRTDLREVLFDITKNIPEFTEPKAFDDYFRLLPQLQIFSDQFALEDLYPRGVAILGESMFSASIKWLDILKAPEESILFYHRYANLHLAYQYSEAVEFSTRSENDLKLLTAAADKIENLRLAVLRQFPEYPDLDLAYRRLLSDMAGRVLVRKDLSESQVQRWILKLSSATQINSFLTTLGIQILAIKAPTAEDSHAYLQRLFSLHQRLLQITDQLTPDVTTAFNDEVVELISMMTSLEVTFVNGEFESALALLPSKSVKQITQTMSEREKLPSGAYADEYLRVTHALLYRLTADGLFDEAKHFWIFAQKMLAPILLQQKGGEGVYDVKDEQGRNWKFTLIRAREDLVFAALGRDGQLYKSYFNITSDLERGGFIASQREPDIDRESNYTMHFEIKADGTIRIDDYTGRPGSRMYQGKKSATFPLFLGDIALRTPPLVTGDYKGTITYLDGKKMTAELIISPFQGYSIARLNILDPKGNVEFFIDYQIGSRWMGHLLRFTSGRLPSQNWNHLRMVLEGDELRGVMLVGGQGFVSQEFTLKKISDK